MKTILHNIIALFALVMGCMVAAYAEIAPKDMKRAKDATPRIFVLEYVNVIDVTRDANDKVVEKVVEEGAVYSVATGSGVLISKDHQYGSVVTNSHVLSKTREILEQTADKIRICQTSGYDAFVVFPQDKGRPRIYHVKERLLHSDIAGHHMDVADVAVLRIASKGLPEPLKFDDRSLGDAEDVYALGYPGVLDSAEAKKTGLELLKRWVASNKQDDTYFTIENLTHVEQYLNISASKGNVTRRDDQAGALGKVYHSATIDHGNSGGPLVDSKGNIVGINTWGKTDSANWFISMSAATVTGMLKTNGINFALYTGEEPPKEESKGPNWVIIGVIGGVVLLVIVAIVLVCVLSGGGKGTPVLSIDVETGERLVITDKMLAGGELLIGRSSACPLRLYDSHISKQHASVFRSGESICIMDVGSKAGTKVNGTALAVRAPRAIRKGDTIEFGKFKAHVH